MNFADIPTFPRASYEIDVPFSMLETTLNGFQREYDLDLLPDFQRGHVWTITQQIRFVEYILKGGESGKTLLFNHSSWHDPVQKKGEFVILDGLQRLTAARKFMANEIPAFGHLRREFSGRMRFMVSFKFRVHSLPDRASVLRYYLDLNGGGTVHSASELDRVKALLDKELQ